MNYKRRFIGFVVGVFVAVSFFGDVSRAEAVFEKSTTLSTSYYFRNSGESFDIFPGYVTGQVDTIYTAEQVTPHTDEASIGDSVRFVFGHNPPFFYNTGGAWDTPYGKWCSGINEQCFSMVDEGSNVNISSGYEGGYAPLPVKLYWTGTRPEVKLISSNPSVVYCPNTGADESLVCQAVGAGTATLSVQVDLTPLRFWLQVYNRLDTTSITYPWFSHGGGYNISNIISSRPPQRGFTLFPNTSEGTLVAEYADETRVRVSLTPTADYLEYLDTLNQRALSDWFSYLSNHEFTAAHITDLLEYEYYTSEHLTFDPFLTQMPLETLVDILTSTNKTSFREAIISWYPVSVPMVSEYSPNNQGNSLFLPKTTLGPWTITVKNPDSSNKPPDLTVSATPLSVKIGQDSTITMTADDPEGDDVKYCVGWNDNDSYDEKATASTDFVQDEGCFPSLGFVPNKESREVKQSWRSIGDEKIVKVIALDNRGNKSEPKKVFVKVKVEDNTTTSTLCTLGATQPCIPTGLPGICSVGEQTCVSQNGTNAWGTCSVTITPNSQAEACNDQEDNNCDGKINEGCSVTPPSTPKCNNNGRCETYKGENPVNCPKDCPTTIKETQAPKPSFWAFVLGALGFR